MLARAQLILVQTLHELGSLDEAQTASLVGASDLSGSDVEKILVDDYDIEQIPLLIARARAYNLSPINIRRFLVSDACFEFLEPGFCKQHNILPIGQLGSYLGIATSDPLNPHLKAEIEGATKKPFVFLLALGEDIRAKFQDDGSGRPGASIDYGELVQALGLEFDIDANDIHDEDFESEESAPVILLSSRIIEDAYFAGASDIHIEPFQRNARVRVRVDGVLKERLTLPGSVAAALLARLKVMANLDIAERRKSQDGRIVFSNYNRKGIDVDLRISTSPLNHGEGAVLRLLDKQRSTLPLQDLGFSEGNLVLYRRLIKRPYGMILHCGPTGSGKSMTLYSALNEVNHPELCIRTAEDPIEYTLPGICQVQMNRRIGVSFASTLRSFLRQDPDIILVGEIRDAETASIAVEAALTGHLLFSTVHTNDAPSTIGRLTDLGVEPYMISSSLLCVCAQRLMRRLCETCKQPCAPEGADRQMLEKALKWTGDIFQAKSSGCPNCLRSGYRGRLGIHEMMATNEELVHAINRGMESSQIKALAVRNGMVTLHQDGMHKVQIGVSSIAECVATVPADLEDLDLLRLEKGFHVREA